MAVFRFARHYVEMLLAMAVGMVVLGLPAEAVLRVAGSSTDAAREQAPAAVLAYMAFSMTAPMVGWMRFRGHSARACWEMTAAMVLPTLLVLALLAGGWQTDVGELLMLEHVIMLPAMLVAMLLRPSEYTGGHHAHAQAAATA